MKKVEEKLGVWSSRFLKKDIGGFQLWFVGLYWGALLVALVMTALYFDGAVDSFELGIAWVPAVVMLAWGHYVASVWMAGKQPPWPASQELREGSIWMAGEQSPRPANQGIHGPWW